ncbi:MAG: tRNA (adenosine(37)-N6)-dimethylallyltransferase MiaA, partial [Candidatus Omnitrophica bacterium]|nr:tRNA (adenosine(37)-N6)-dimethylallyltransferase MiaA [Candidatus Omnitrophota bacterium]
FLKEIPHHLIDIVEPTEVFDAVRYRTVAIEAIDEILSRGSRPLVVGGSGLYIKVLLEGIFDGPSADPLLRERLYQEAAASGPRALHQRLQEVDPESAAVIHANDARKMIRALEVYYQSGEPISHLKPARESLEQRFQIRVVGLNRPRAVLYQRIDERVDQMFSQGLLEECRRLMDLPLSQTARQALGYKEVFRHLRGEISLEEAIRLVKQNTRRYAKRQLTWFRREPSAEWIEISQEDSVKKIAEEVIRRFAL